MEHYNDMPIHEYLDNLLRNFINTSQTHHRMIHDPNHELTRLIYIELDRSR